MTTQSGLTYKFGWLVAWGALTNTADPALIKDWSNVLGAWGSVLGIMMSGWNLVIGLAAAAVRPWSWYVLLGCFAFGPVWGAIYMTLIAPDWRSRAVGAVGALAFSLIGFAYFYRRRALFRARWQWPTLERWWPRLIGPETLGHDVQPGFTGLSSLRRGLFIAATAIWGAVRLLSGL